MKECQQCSYVVNDFEKTCPNCGSNIVAKPSSRSGSTVQGYEMPQGAVGSVAGAPNPNPNAEAVRPAPPSYMVQSILCILFCCWPFAVAALVYNSKIDKLMFSQRYDEAYAASAKAKNWLIASFVTGLVLNLGILIVYIAVPN